jgi:hypothetical protein
LLTFSLFATGEISLDELPLGSTIVAEELIELKIEAVPDRFGAPLFCILSIKNIPPPITATPPKTKNKFLR